MDVFKRDKQTLQNVLWFIWCKQRENTVNRMAFDFPDPHREETKQFYLGEKMALDNLQKEITEWIHKQEEQSPTTQTK